MNHNRYDNQELFEWGVTVSLLGFAIMMIGSLVLLPIFLYYNITKYAAFLVSVIGTLMVCAGLVLSMKGKWG